MNKQELIKKYQEIVLKTNGGNDDYVVALCQIAQAINELEESSKETQKDHQIVILEKALELACKEVPSGHCPDLPERYNLQDEYGSDEPYWVSEGGCELQDHCLECCINYFKEQAEKEIGGKDE